MPVRWTAPEALETRKYSVATDVWAYGILLYEIWTKGQTPYDGWSNQKVWVEVQSGYRLPMPAGCSADVYGSFQCLSRLDACLFWFTPLSFPSPSTLSPSLFL